MNEWIKLGNNKKIKSMFDGKVAVIAPQDTDGIVPLFCPCCNFPMRTTDDSVSYRKYKVCNKCNERWTGKPGVEWPKGPDKTSDEWQKYIENRLLFEKVVIKFK